MTLPIPLSDNAFRRELHDGLLLRWSTADDTEGLMGLYGDVFREEPEHPPNEHVGMWARDMMSGRHPLITPNDFALVEDTRSGAIVAATCLLAQVWEYAGIAFPIGRPEAVATDPAHRNRGLIRGIFELIHARSASMGHVAQGITGIPYYYRQFGYEYALDLGGGRDVYFAAIPKPKASTPEPFTLRDATIADLPVVRALYDRERALSLVSTRIDDAYWRWRLAGCNPTSYEGWRTQLIVDARERAVGYVLTGRERWGSKLPIWGMSVEPDVSLMAVLPPVMRALQLQADSLPAEEPDAPPADRLEFGLGGHHPVYEALGDALATVPRPPYAWYVRVPDLPAFLRLLAPVLERRLAASVLAGHSGEVKLDFYRGGLRLVFAQGRLAEVEHWRRPAWGKRQGGFPPLVFLQLLFGRRSLDELRHAFPDVWADDETAPLLRALFPPQPSLVMPLD